MPQATFVPRFIAEKMCDDGSMMVSVAHPGEWPSLDHWQHVIRLWFDDIERPEEGLHMFSPDDAKRLIDKLDAAGGNITVHCTAGLSRSAAIAKWLQENRGYDIWLHPEGARTTLHYNRHVYRMLTEADGNSLASWYRDMAGSEG